MKDKSRNQKHWHIYKQPELLPSGVIFGPLLLMLIAAWVIS